MTIPEDVRFWSKVHKADGCWTWTAGTDGHGYGKFWSSSHRAQSKAHRISFELSYGVEPGDLFVCHECDNPPCVRPDHLFLGTQRDNIRDAQRKGRLVHRSPGPQARALFTERVREMWATATPEMRARLLSGLKRWREDAEKVTDWLGRYGKRAGRPGSSRFIGVSFTRGAWRAYLKTKGKTRYLGTFASEIDAALAFDVAARESRQITRFNFNGHGDSAEERRAS